MQHHCIFLVLVFLLFGSVTVPACSRHEDSQTVTSTENAVQQTTIAGENYDFLNPTIDNLPAILEDIETGDPFTSETARDAVNNLLRNPEAVEALADASRDIYSPMHDQAEQALQYAGLRRSIAPTLVESLWGKDSSIRFTGDIDRENPGLDPDTAVPILAQALHSEDQFIRSNALDILAMLGHDAAPAVPDVIDILKNDPIEFLRGAAAMTLNGIGDNGSEVSDALIDALDDTQWQVRGFALNSLASLCPQDPRLPELMNVCFYDDTVYVKTAAVTAMVTTGHATSEAIGYLADQLASDKPITRQMAARLLGEIGPQAASALPALRQLLDSEEDWSVIDATQLAINQIEEEGQLTD